MKTQNNKNVERESELSLMRDKIVMYGIAGLIGLGLGGATNYGVNSYRIRKHEVPMKNVSRLKMLTPSYIKEMVEKDPNESYDNQMEGDSE